MDQFGHFFSFKPGAPVGSMLFPWLTTVLIEQYGWRGAMMLTSGVMAQVCCVAFLLVTPKTKPLNLEIKSQDQCVESKNNTDNQDRTQWMDEKTEESICSTIYRQTKTIFKNKNFVFVWANTALVTFSSSVAFTHIVAYAESEGLDPTWSSFLVTMLAVGSFGRCFSKLF